MLKFLFGDGEEKAKREGEQALAKARYEALQQQNQLEMDHHQKLLDQERGTWEKLEEAAREKADAEKEAHEEKMGHEREKTEILKESNDTHMKLIAEKNKTLMEMQKETERKTRETDNIARANETKLRTENEQKMEQERKEAREREDRTQAEIKNTINEAKRSAIERNDKAHADVTRLVIDNQKNKDELMKEHIKTIEAKDAANAEKLDKLTSNYQSQVKETQELAQQRVDKLHLEKKAADEQFRKDLENRDQISKQERDQITAEYHQMIEKKDDQLSKIQSEKAAKIEELNHNHLAHLKEARENYNQLQESCNKDRERLHREKEEDLRESVAQIKGVYNKMIKMEESKNKELLLQGNLANQLVAMSLQNQLEAQRVSDCRDELAPLKGFKKSLNDNAVESCDLWMDFEPPNEVMQSNIIDRSKAMKKNISDMWRTIDECRSLGEQKKEWKDALNNLESNHATPYYKSVKKDLNDKVTKEKTSAMEDECEKLKEAIQNLPDMEVESSQALMILSTQRLINLSQSQNAMTVIENAKKEEKIESMQEGPIGDPVVEEP